MKTLEDTLRDIYGRYLNRGDLVVYSAEGVGIGGLKFGIIVAVRDTPDQKMTIKLLPTSPYFYNKKAERAVWTSTTHMLRIDPSVIPKSVYEMLHKWYVNYMMKHGVTDDFRAL